MKLDKELYCDIIKLFYAAICVFAEKRLIQIRMCHDTATGQKILRSANALKKP